MQLTKFHKILLGALAAQLVLVFVVLFTGGDASLAKEVPLLPSLDAATVTRIQIYGPEAGAKPVDLVKSDKGWKLASGFNYPVDNDKVDKLLARSRRWSPPIRSRSRRRATSSSRSRTTTSTARS